MRRSREVTATSVTEADGTQTAWTAWWRDKQADRATAKRFMLTQTHNTTRPDVAGLAGREVWVHGLPSRSTAVVAVVAAAVADIAMLLTEARAVSGVALVAAAAAAYCWLLAEENAAYVCINVCVCVCVCV